MQIKITRPDGTTIEAEGSVEECAALVQKISPTPTTVYLTPAPVAPTSPEIIYIPVPTYIPNPAPHPDLGPPMWYGGTPPSWPALTAGVDVGYGG